MIAIQIITTTWTKAARGGPLATLRNRIPKQLPLRFPDRLSHAVRHIVGFHESNQFAAPIISTDALPESKNEYYYSNADINWDGDTVTLKYIYQSGAPLRTFYDNAGNIVPTIHAINIPLGRWASVEFNTRHTDIDEGSWWYEHVVVNVANGQTISANLFMADQPIERYKRLSKLF